jgi:hypothetical protein
MDLPAIPSAILKRCSILNTKARCSFLYLRSSIGDAKVGMTVRDGPTWTSWKGDDLTSVVMGKPGVTGEGTVVGGRRWRV